MSLPIIDTDPRKTLPDKEMLQLVIERFQRSKRIVDSLRGRRQDWYRLYRSYVEDPEAPFETRLFIPLVFSTVEAFLPRLVAQRPQIKVAARNDEDIRAAQMHRELLLFQWDLMGMPTKLIELVKSALIYGTAWAKVGWERKTRVRPVRRFTTDPTTGQRFQFDDEEEVEVYNGPVVDIVDGNSIYPDPDGWSVETCKYIAEHMRLHWYEIDERARPRDQGGLGWDKEAVNKLKELRLSAINQQLKKERDLAREDSMDQSPADSGSLDLVFDVIEYWEDNRYAVITLDPELVLFNGINPYWHGKKPYIRLVDNLLPGEIYGVGEPEVLESLNLELNDLHNLRLEAMKRDILQMFKVKIGSPVWSQNIKFVPQGKIPVQDPDDIVELFTRGPKSITYREEDTLRLWAQLATGATDPFTGIESNIGAETATGASILAQAAASRVGLKFQLLIELALRPLGRMLIALNEQFLTEENEIKIVGPEAQGIIKIDPQDLIVLGPELDVRIDVGATDPVNRELGLQRTIQALQLVGPLLGGDPSHPVVQTLLNRLLDLLDIPLPPEQVSQQPVPQSTNPGTPPGVQGAGVPLPSRSGLGLADRLAAAQSSDGS